MSWTVTELGNVATFQRGFDITKRQQSEGPYRVISSSGPSSWHSEAKVRGPGVVIGRKGSLGGVYYSDDDFWPHDTTLWVKDFHGNDPRFVYYFLQTLGLAQLDVGAANPTLNRNHIHVLPVAIPPLPTQRKIAAVLTAYDDLIESNSRRIKLLEEIAQRIYHEWFVNFRYPDHEGVALIDSELGRIPKGWHVARVGDYLEVVRGRSYRGVDIAREGDGGVPFVNLKCVARDGGFRASGLKRYLGAFKASHRVYPGDVVMAVTDMTQERRVVARAARVPAIGEEFAVVSMDLVKIIPQNVPSEYLYGMLRYSGFADEVKAHANGANVLHLHPDRITDYRSVVPPKSLMDHYARLVAPMDSLSDLMLMQQQALKSARNLLLSPLVSGEIDVKDVDISLEEAA